MINMTFWHLCRFLGIITITLFVGVSTASVQSTSQPATSPTSSSSALETLSPDQTLEEWFTAMNDGNSSRALELAETNNDTKRWILAHTSAENALEDLKIAALLRVGDVGRLEIEHNVNARLGMQQFQPAVMQGNTATKTTVKDPKKFVTFLQANGIWKLDLSGDWMHQGIFFEQSSLAHYCQVAEQQITECERIKDLLDTGKITSNLELRRELILSARTISNEYHEKD